MKFFSFTDVGREFQSEIVDGKKDCENSCVLHWIVLIWWALLSLYGVMSATDDGIKVERYVGVIE